MDRPDEPAPPPPAAPPARPLFAQVGRDAKAPADATSRVFNLVIALGVVGAIGAFLVELATAPPAMRYVEIDMTARPDRE
jgi:hypothetical protein